MKTKVIYLRIDSDVYKKIKVIAKEEGRTFAGQINHMLKQLTKNQRQAKKDI